ncbi:hypothetical protein B0H34DRAFT_686285 [Crassisporium funariophilum]|nr:hypothetical protein B0H34DRAFT_686285 [Crassisporium funariophilum]
MNAGNHEQQMDAYMNSLTPATNLALATGRNPHPNVQPQGPSPEEEMQRQLDEFNRSVTIIIWYKAGVDPIRLQQFLPTFPYFQLSRFNTLIGDLGLTPSSYLDTYIPISNQWEQHTITSVRIVETQQRLLYKLRRTLMEGLAEDDCLSLRDEVQIQSSRNPRPQPSATNITSATSVTHPTKQQTPSVALNSQQSNEVRPLNTLKRPAPQGDIQDLGHNSKVHVSNAYYMSHSGNANMVSTTTSPVTGPSPSTASPSNVTNDPSNGQDNSVYMYQNPVFYGGAPPDSPANTVPLPPYLLNPPTPTPPIPYHPHPPLKRWPNDYTVSELSGGFHAMDLLISQSSTGSSMTQRTAFERVFGSRYVKSTVCRHRAVWRKAQRTVREHFEAMGTDDRACWGEFVRRVEGRPPGKNSGLDSMSMAPAQGSNSLGYHDHPPTADGEDVHGQEPVMATLQNQGNSTSNNNPSMQPSEYASFSDLVQS